MSKVKPPPDTPKVEIDEGGLEFERMSEGDPLGALVYGHHKRDDLSSQGPSTPEQNDYETMS
jgi:hypothetical protein